MAYANITIDTANAFTNLGFKPSYIGNIYFHGELDKKVGYDVVYSCSFPSELVEGCHLCNLLNGDLVKMYVWYDKYGVRHGLVVDPKDSKSVNYARNCMKKRMVRL